MQNGKHLLFLFVGLFAMNYSCNFESDSIAPLDSTTQKFSSYLKVNFDDSIPQKHHLFILVAANDSKENTSTILSRISKEIKHSKVESCTSIISAKLQLPDSTILPGIIHVDYDNAIEKLKMNFSSVALVQTEGNKVSEILQVSVDSTGIEKLFLNR